MMAASPMSNGKMEFDEPGSSLYMGAGKWGAREEIFMMLMFDVRERQIQKSHLHIAVIDI